MSFPVVHRLLVIYYGELCLYVANNFFCFPVFCLKLGSSWNLTPAKSEGRLKPLSFHSSHRTQFVSIIKATRLTSYRGTNAVCCQKNAHTQSITYIVQRVHKMLSLSISKWLVIHELLSLKRFRAFDHSSCAFMALWAGR
jgi:hypothetical protein